MSEKQCIKCGGIKPLSAYTTARRTVDKLSPTCKSCKKSYDKARRERLRKDPEWVEWERARFREGYSSGRYARIKTEHAKKKKSTEKYNKRWPEKKLAQGRAYRAIPTAKGMNNHHWSYNDEHHLDVIQLEKNFHQKVHRFLEYCTETFYYRTLDGVLLDTRKKHENYIKTLT